MMSSLRAWVKTARITDDPAGDLIQDMQGDVKGYQNGELPNAIGELEEYLLYRRACQGALEALPEVWRRYRGEGK